MRPTKVPAHAQVLIIGGGPAGSYTASVLASEGLQVVLLEAMQFPRYHIGESLLPSVRHYLRFIGAEQKLVEYGFKIKPGAAIKFSQFKREGYTEFIGLGHRNGSWNVTRSDFDNLLLDHARESGASVYETTKVISLRFSDTDISRPISAEWKRSHPTDESGEISFDFLVDATGRAGLMCDRYLKNRHYNESLRNIAFWGYWTGVGVYGQGTEREGAPWFETLTDDSGWAWFIPLHDGTTSIGVVVNHALFLEKCKALPESSMVARYQAMLTFAPNLTRLIGNGILVPKPSPNGSTAGSLVRSAADFSYSAPQYAGNAFRIVGDAGAFIDPLFSSGVHLAMTSALSAAASICASIRGECSEAAAAAWHTKRFTLSYTRFQMVVLSAYQQIRATRFNIFDDVDEGGYERAFTTIRPVIHGAADVGTRLSEQELQNALDFCSKFFLPTTPEQRQYALQCGVPDRLLDVSVEPVDPREIDITLTRASMTSPPSDGESVPLADVRPVVEQTNARRIVQPEYFIHNLQAEGIDGYAVRLQRGSLGLSGTG